MKKILSIALVLCMVLALGCTAFADDDVSVAMITDYGDITDQSFNQTTYEACKAFADEKGLTFQYYKPASDSERLFHREGHRRRLHRHRNARLCFRQGHPGDRS